jgi:hypothetical protein
MKNFRELLLDLNACEASVLWAKDKTIEKIVSTVHRGDWLLWLAKELDLPLNKLILAKARCAKTVIHLMKDKRSVRAVEVAERFGLDECTLNELEEAGKDAYAAYVAAYASAPYTAYAAAYAASAADADVTVYDTYASAANADVTAYNAARKKNQKQTANICREILGELIIQKVNQLIINNLKT